MKLRVWIGWDPREQDAYAVAEASLRRHASIAVDVQPLVLEDLRGRGLYQRPTIMREGRLWDVISNAPMSTEFALTRMLVPPLAGWEGWSLYVDCDFLFRADVAELLEYCDERFALLCVPHLNVPSERTKMDGQVQTSYARKLWSSFVMWNNAHLKHVGQIDRVQRWPGLALQQFRWLDQREIGALDHDWNWIEGVSDPKLEPKAAHFTRGVPSMPGYENAAYADEWREELARLKVAA